jgi:hypothetical protein
MAAKIATTSSEMQNARPTDQKDSQAGTPDKKTKDKEGAPPDTRTARVLMTVRITAKM